MLTSRRALLALVGGATLGSTAACDLGSGTGGRTGGAGAPATDPDQRLLDTAVTELKVVRERVLRTVDRHPGTRAELSAVATCLEAHLSALGEEDLTTPTVEASPGVDPGSSDPAGATGGATGDATASPTPGSEAGTDAVPDDRDAAVAAVVTALTVHTDALVGWSARAESGPFARLLAVMAAGTSQYLTTLRKAA